MRIVWLLLCLSALPAAAQTKIQVDVQLVQFGFSVRDASGALRNDLTADDFEVLEDGEPQRIARFAGGDALPLRLGVLIDNSGSQDAFREEHLRDLQAFLHSLLDEGDGAFLIGYGDRLRLISPLTADADAILERAGLYRRGTRFDQVGPRENRRGGTAFFDSLYHAIQEMLAGSGSGRRAIVQLSDGADNSSLHNLLDVIDAAQSHDVRLFSVRYAETDENNVRKRYGRRVMERLAENTGGQMLISSDGGLEEQFRRIADDLRASYEIGYYSTNPTPDGRFRQVEIRTKRPGLTVRAKPGYYAR